MAIVGESSSAAAANGASAKSEDSGKKSYVSPARNLRLIVMSNYPNYIFNDAHAPLRRCRRMSPAILAQKAWAMGDSIARPTKAPQDRKINRRPSSIASSLCLLLRLR